MALFGYKNDSHEFKTLESFNNELNNLLSLDKYISKKEYLSFYNNTKTTFAKLELMRNENVLQSWCKKERCDYKKIRLFSTKKLVKL